MVTRLHLHRERGEETGYEEEKEGRRRRLQRSEEASELSGPFRGFAWRDARERRPASSRNFVFVSRRDFTTMLHYHPHVVAYARLPLSFDERSFYLCSFLAHFGTVIRGRDGYGGWGIPTSLRRCCCATVRPFHRNQSKLARCPSVCLIEIRTVTVAADKRSLQAMLVKIVSTDRCGF